MSEQDYFKLREMIRRLQRQVQALEQQVAQLQSKEQ